MLAKMRRKANYCEAADNHEAVEDFLNYPNFIFKFSIEDFFVFDSRVKNSEEYE